MTEKARSTAEAAKRATLPYRLKRELGEAARSSLENSESDLGLFDPVFYRRAKAEADRWARGVGTASRMTVFVPAGLFGTGVGHAMPDWDISLLGVGNHRFFLFHSAMSVWIARKMYDAYRVKSGQAEPGHDSIVSRILGVAVGGAAFGAGVHLLVDVFQPKSVVFPFFGSLLDGTLVDDNIWLLGNSLWCFKMSRDVFVLALGRDLETVKDFTRRHFTIPLKSGVLNALHVRP